ncbi:MAG: hypothetical protein WA705_23400 [Candidatus Ozemobacteraceae bacterium]
MNDLGGLFNRLMNPRFPVTGREGRTALQWALIFGILTSLLLPFVQIWSVEAVPLFASDEHRRAAIAVENLMSETLAKPFSEIKSKSGYKAIPGTEELGLEGRVEILPHPDIPGLTLVRAQVRWGFVLFRKTLSLEAAMSQTRP